MKINVLYEDNHVIVVVKPSNILSQKDDTGDMDMITLIKAYLKEKYQKPFNVYLGLVHRLDRPVSGVMVFAKTSKAASRLSSDIRDRILTKDYVAVVHGRLKDKKGEFCDYLEKKIDHNTVISDDVHGKYATLSYEVLEENKDKNLSLVLIHLETGRHHQIRVQFASRGYPLYGDNRYGKCEKENIALCAYKLSFMHPVKKEVMEFSLPFPSVGIWCNFSNNG